MPITTGQAIEVMNRMLGLRSGSEPKNAAYGMDDIAGDGDWRQQLPTQAEILAWEKNPDTPKWRDRLWNTVQQIRGLAPDSGQILLLTRAGSGSERYSVQGDDRRGDGYTFAKCSKVQPDTEPIATIRFDAGSTTDALCGEIVARIPDEPQRE